MGLNNLWKRWFGDAEPAEPARPADPAFDARTEFWKGVGSVERELIDHVGATGENSSWPGPRRAFRVVRRSNGAVVLATEGLSDPFPDGREPNGFELFIECADLPPTQAGAPGDLAPLREGWMPWVLGHVADIVAAYGGLSGALDQFGVIPLELRHASRNATIRTHVPDYFLTSDDALGVLVGKPCPQFAAAAPMRMVPVVLLTAGELSEVRAGDETTVEALTDALAGRPYNHLLRESLV